MNKIKKKKIYERIVYCPGNLISCGIEISIEISIEIRNRL